jgi:hypothetical protein
MLRKLASNSVTMSSRNTNVGYPCFSPFGPFVPLPRDMAIQIMREQRPPRPNGARCGKERLMPGSVMPMYTHFLRDPRPLRKSVTLLSLLCFIKFCKVVTFFVSCTMSRIR